MASTGVTIGKLGCLSPTCSLKSTACKMNGNYQDDEQHHLFLSVVMLGKADMLCCFKKAIPYQPLYLKDTA